MKKNNLNNGASGFNGSFLVEEAIKKDYRVFAGIRNYSSRQYLKDPGIHFLELDFSNSDSLDISLRNFAGKYGNFDFIIHNAGITKAKNSHPFDLVNFENTNRFVHALQRNQLVPGKFIYISSVASFGPGENTRPISALHTRRPLTAYGRSKLKAEEFLYTTRDFPFLIINPTAVYGPREKDVFFLLKSIEKHLEVYIGTTQQLLSFIHVQDLCEAVFLSMESTALNQNLLVSDFGVYTAKEFNHMVKKNLNKRTVSFILPVSLVRIVAFLSECMGRIRGEIPVLNRERLKEFEAKNWGVDCTDISKLGFIPQFSLEEGLKQTIGWYKKQGWMKG